MTNVAIGLGANLGDPVRQIRAAVSVLCEHSAINVLAVSRFYCGPLMGSEGPLPNEPLCVNAALTATTTLSPNDLLNTLKSLEKSLGRPDEHPRWSSRIIDCDILLYGDKVINEERLTLPHPGVATRPFVLLPLGEIASDWQLPDGRRIDALASVCCRDGFELLKEEHEINV